ncbi:MAG: hypothetical protein EAZ97_01530 [Bacteroidetes bacterium]|nr:MAG: hypothetical protein EAZ97_01530 [Bacteroidota bacterium]
MFKNLVIILSVFAIIFSVKTYLDYQEEKNKPLKINYLTEKNSFKDSFLVSTEEELPKTLAPSDPSPEFISVMKTYSNADSGIWKKLMSVKYEIGADFYRPKFNAKVLALQGQNIELKGFMIPIEEVSVGKDAFLISYYPFAACFFCGGAGPESVAEVKPSKPIPYRESAIKIRGKLILNDDPEKILKNYFLRL